jgi:pilus assembly protein Flp/PilA
MKTLKNFLIDESGATAIEYGLMSAIIFIGLLTTLTSFNGSIVGYYERIAEAMLAAFGMSP